MIHDSEISLKSKMPNVQPPSAHRRLGDFHAFGLGIGSIESSDNKVDLARSGLLVWSLVELGGLWGAGHTTC